MTEEPTRPATHVRWPASDEPNVDVLPRDARDFQGHRAGVVSRTLANTVDFALTQVVVLSLYLGWLVVLFLLNPTKFSVPKVNFGTWLIASGVLITGYFWISWITTGRTYGDHILGLRVVGVRGTRMRPVWALLRAIFCVFVPIGLFWAAVSRQNRSLQDTLMRTSVIYDWVTNRPEKAKPDIRAAEHPEHGPAEPPTTT
ncbi:MAG: RDD family protein [Actinomycetes bacterium]